MPRGAREKSESGIYHLILRGINGQAIFEEEEDALKFIETLEKYKSKSEYKLYGYCLMGNHIHLLLKEENESLAIIMRRIGACYVYWYNSKYDRSGHLFQDRFKSEAVEDESYLLTVLRYIHQNPLEADIVQDIENYKWSSYSEYLSKRTTFIDSDFILSIFNKDKKEAISMFKKFHLNENNKQCLDADERKRIRDNEAAEIVREVCDVSHCIDLQTFGKADRDKYLRLLKKEGLSTRQLARLTGISRYMILKA